MAKKGEYRVGYGKPPKSGQFQKGQSGNPKGRPKGRKKFGTIIEDVLHRKIVVREGGKTKKVSRIEALVSRVANDALKGNARSTEQVFKLTSAMSVMSAQTAPNDDGTLPDAAADEAVIKAYFALRDVHLDKDGDEENEDE